MNAQAEKIEKINDTPVKVLVRKFGRHGFGHEVFLPLRPWQMGDDGDKYPKVGIYPYVVFGSVIDALVEARRAAAIHPSSFVDMDKKARAQLVHEFSTDI